MQPTVSTVGGSGINKTAGEKLRNTKMCLKWNFVFAPKLHRPHYISYMRTWQYLRPYAINQKTKGTLHCSTFKFKKRKCLYSFDCKDRDMAMLSISYRNCILPQRLKTSKTTKIKWINLLRSRELWPLSNTYFKNQAT